jgi:light-regulated signal transduction histidine kinase (bacteriophytochrome)
LRKNSVFGFLFVFDHTGCIAVSENAKEITLLNSSSLLGRSVDDILELIVPTLQLNSDDIETRISDKIFYRFVERITINEIDYFLSIYRYNEKLYVEIEACNPQAVKTTKLYYYAKYLESQHDNNSAWQPLTELIREIIGYDRVMVYQFLEDKKVEKLLQKVKTRNLNLSWDTVILNLIFLHKQENFTGYSTPDILQMLMGKLMICWDVCLKS